MACERQHKAWTVKAWIASGLLLVTITLLMSMYIPGCGVSNKADPAPAPAPTDDGGDDGDDDGGDDGGAPSCDGPTFDDIKPVLTNKCVSCHFAPDRIDTYDLASDWGDDIVRRINLGQNNNDRMPPPPAAPLSATERTQIAAWVKAGKPEKCDTSAGGGGTKRLRDLNRAILDDLNNLDEDDQQQTRYLITYDLLNDGAEETAIAGQAIDKTLNSLNIETDDLAQTRRVAPGVYAVDLEEFGLEDKWDLIEQADPLNIVDETVLGKQVRQITGTNKPWMHASNFVDFTQRNSALYYNIMGTPATLTQLQALINLDFADELQDFEATFAGSTDSPISLKKNRLIMRMETDDGYYWETFDPIALNGVPQRNLFEFPFIQGTGGSKIFQHAAGEVIYSLPNGMQAYALFDAAGNRQDAAPTNVVADNESPINVEIRNAQSCHRCHAAGIITMKDQIRDHITRNAGQFSAQDVQIARALYKPANVLTATFKRDIDFFGKVLKEIGVDPSKDDPITLLSDRFLVDWNLSKVAAFLLMSEKEFREALQQSGAAQAQIGQLLTGGLITHDQFEQALPVLIQDLRLFQEPLGE